MNLKYPVVLALILLMPLHSFTQNISNPTAPSDPGGIVFTTDTLKVVLYEKDSVVENRTITIHNNGGENLTLGLSLTNTINETVPHTRFLGTPTLYKSDFTYIRAKNAATNEDIAGSSIHYGYDFPDADGLAYDGRFLYYVSKYSPTIIYKIDTDTKLIVDTTYVSDFSGMVIEGLAYSGKSLYASNISDNTINEIDLENGDIIDQIYVENLGTGLTFGGNRGTLYATTSTYETVEINIVTKEIINRFDIPRGTEGLGYSRELDLLFIDYYLFRCRAVNPDNGELLYIVNLGGYGMAADEYFGLKWLEFESIRVPVNAGSSRDLGVTFNPTDLAPGQYKTTLQLASNDGSGSVASLPIIFEIIPLTEPLVGTSVCTAASEQEQLWEINNPNDIVVNAVWQIASTGQTDSILLQPGNTTLLTEAVSGFLDTLSISWLDERGVAQSNDAFSSDILCETRGLTLTTECSENPDDYRPWKIFNPNLFTTSVDWIIEETGVGGVLDLASGEFMFTTAVGSPGETQTMKIIWRDEENNVKRQRSVSDGTPCDLRGLTLSPPECISDPDAPILWEIFNPNEFFVSVDWLVEGPVRDRRRPLIPSRGTSFAAPGITTISAFTNIIDSIATIIWRDEEGNIKRQRKTVTYTPCSDSSLTSGRRASLDKEVKDSALTPFNVFPNPFDQKLSVLLNVDNDAIYKITLYDMLGNEVYSEVGNTISGRIEEQIHTSTMAKGTYILNIVSGESLHRFKLIKE